MNKIIQYIMLALIPFTLSAEDSRYAAAFTELGIDARALGMGSAYVALSNDVTGSHWNPAGLAFLPNFQASSMYANLFNALETQSYVGVAMPVFGGATVSLSWIRLSVDDIPRYEFTDTHSAYQRISDPGLVLDAPPIDYFSAYDDAYVITFAKHNRWNMDLGWQYFEVPVDLGFGMNLKMLRQSVDNNVGSGIGLDLGVMGRIGLNEVFADELFGDLTLGINIQDLTGTQIAWDTDSKHKDRLTPNFKYGFSYIQPIPFIKSAFTFAFDLDTRYSGTSHLGGEFLYNSALAVRVGANSGFLTAGAGLSLWKFRFDYAYQSHDLGNSHRVSVLVGL